MSLLVSILLSVVTHSKKTAAFPGRVPAPDVFTPPPMEAEAKEWLEERKCDEVSVAKLVNCYSM